MNRRIYYKVAVVSIIMLVFSGLYALTAWATESIRMGADATIQIAATIIGSLLLLVNGFALFVLSGMRQDMKEIWDRMYDHEHMIECKNASCEITKTSGVIVPSSGRRK